MRACACVSKCRQQCGIKNIHKFNQIFRHEFTILAAITKSKNLFPFFCSPFWVVCLTYKYCITIVRFELAPSLYEYAFVCVPCVSCFISFRVKHPIWIQTTIMYQLLWIKSDVFQKAWQICLYTEHKRWTRPSLNTELSRIPYSLTRNLRQHNFELERSIGISSMRIGCSRV